MDTELHKIQCTTRTALRTFPYFISPFSNLSCVGVILYDIMCPSQYLWVMLLCGGTSPPPTAHPSHCHPPVKRQRDKVLGSNKMPPCCLLVWVFVLICLICFLKKFIQSLAIGRISVLVLHFWVFFFLLVIRDIHTRSYKHSTQFNSKRVYWMPMKCHFPRLQIKQWTRHITAAFMDLRG